MKSEPDRTGLDEILASAMVDLPEPLQERLQRIPAPTRQVNWALPLTLLFLTPLVVWGGWQLLPYLTGWLTQLAGNPWSFALTGWAAGSQYGWFALAGLGIVMLFLFVAVRDREVWR